MTDKKKLISRRSLFSTGAGLGALALTTKSLLAKEANKKNLPPNVPEWTEALGEISRGEETPDGDVDGIFQQFIEDVAEGIHEGRSRVRDCPIQRDRRESEERGWSRRVCILV